MRLLRTTDRRGTVRGPRRRAGFGVAALAAALLTATFAPASGAAVAQEPAPGGDCAVTVTAAVSAPSIPDGGWSTTPTCIAAETVYETEVLGYGLIGGLGIAEYADGHRGRVAFLSALLPDGRSLTLVGVEDYDAGRVTWSYADGVQTDVDGARRMSGPGEAVTIPAEGAEPGELEGSSLELTVEGRGTDLATAEGEVAEQLRLLVDQAVAALTAEQPAPETPPVEPPADDAEVPATTVAPDTAPAPEDGDAGAGASDPDGAVGDDTPAAGDGEDTDQADG